MKIALPRANTHDQITSEERLIVLIDLDPNLARELLRLTESAEAIRRIGGFRGGAFDALAFIDNRTERVGGNEIPMPVGRWTSLRSLNPRLPAGGFEALPKARPGTYDNTRKLPDDHNLAYYDYRPEGAKMMVAHNGINFVCDCMTENGVWIRATSPIVPRDLIATVAADGAPVGAAAR